MRKKSILTLSTVEGTRSVRMNRIVFPLLTMVAVLFATGFMGGWLYSHYLSIQNMEIRNENSRIQQKYSTALSSTSTLSEELNRLSGQIIGQSEMMQKIGAIEKLLIKKKSNDIFASPALVAFDTHRGDKDPLALINNEIDSKIRILYALPSGTPLQEDTYISSGFGRRQHPVHARLQFHQGMDMPLQIGDEVISTADGTVIFSGRKGGYGKAVIISHAYGFSTYYSHLNKILVTVGEIVTKGEVIALGGKTGVSTGPHLHYELRYIGKAINPYHFYNWNLMNFDNIFTKGIKVNWQEIIAAVDHDRHMQGLRLSRTAQN